ncbi:Imidazole glycerol phosphate synthase amidotransferase subunit HisH [Olavius sp. associated proteobacterium Delta 1]|nr:Imidazole glycerol phosphate synthase amidotransferase subunit HisH [Olavius sp. associated proteobacterium Delta 1]
MEVAIVDYGLGNLFSVKHACSRVGLDAEITSSGEAIIKADAVILPGVGAFGDAMENLQKLDLIEPLHDAARFKPLMGICLGMQLLMSESEEFGNYKGLGIIPGRSVRFENPIGEGGRAMKVPHVGWNQILSATKNYSVSDWDQSLLKGIGEGEYMYFVHSFYVQVDDRSVEHSISTYGNIEFCSSLRLKQIFASQFHPERSGVSGLRIYHNFKNMIHNK